MFTREIDQFAGYGHQRMKIHSRHQHHRFQTGNGVTRTVGVNGREAAVVPGIHRLQQFESLRPANLADDKAICPSREIGRVSK